MRLPIDARDVAPRLMTGVFMLHSGLSKHKNRHDEQMAQGVHGMAVGAYPFLDRVPPLTFLRLLSITEMSLGTALLLPLVPTAVGGAGLTAFSSALLGLYIRTPALREEGSLAPSEQGIAMAKDSWLFGIGLGFLTDACVSREHRRRSASRWCH